MHDPDMKRPLEITNSTKSHLHAPPSYYQRWMKEQAFPSQITFGSKTVSCTLDEHPEQKEEWLLSADLAQMLSIPYKTMIHVFQNDHLLHIGPLVGIFTAGFTPHRHRPVGERSILFSKYLALAKDIGGYFFMFGSHHIDWDKGSMKGLFYTDHGWKKHDVPIPHVVYDRLPNRKTEKSSQSQKVKNRLQKQYMIPWFNAGFFDKRHVFDVLNEASEIKQYLPETIENPSIDDMKALFQKYDHIYVKPANGSLGLGVHQIIKRESEPYYYCRFRHNGTNRLRRYRSLKQLIDQLLTEKRLKTMVAQQGINLMKVEGRPLDFRIHANKDIKGKWQVSAIAAKISGPNSVTTHLKSGGSVKSVAEISKLRDEEPFHRSLSQLTEVSLRISHILDERTAGFLGEIGFDMGIDQQGNIWMFEANSKPGRSIFSHPDLKHEELLTRRLPLEYAVHLAKTSVLKPGLVTI